jgi:peptide/nickel transport system substrate-binding protein
VAPAARSALLFALPHPEAARASAWDPPSAGPLAAPVRRRAVLAGMAGAVLLAGCGGPGGSGEAATAATGPVDRAQELHRGNVVTASHLDPHAATSELAWFLTGLPSVYDQLFVVDAAGRPEGRLVTEWSYGQEGLSLRLALREGVTFRDGVPLDAAAVKTSLDRARTLQTPAVKQRMEPVIAVEVTAPYEVVLMLDRPTPSMPSVLADCAGFIMHPDLVANGDPATQVNGSGAYSVESFTPGQQLSMARDRDDYWDPDAAQFARITHTAYPEASAYANAMASGAIEIGQFQPGQELALDGRRGLRVERVPVSVGMDLFLNQTLAPLDRLEVRQAVNHAYDRKAIVEALYVGSVPKHQYAREGLPGHDPALEDAYPFDPARARELLARAGFPDGVDLGEVIVSQSVVGGLGDVLQRQLSEAGIRSSFVTVSSLEVIPRWAAGGSPAFLGFSSYGTDFAGGAASRWGTQQPGDMPEDYNRLMGLAADNRIPEEQREAGYQAVNRYLVEQALAAPIVWINYPWVMSDRVVGFGPEMTYTTTVGPHEHRYLGKTAEA